MTRWKATKNRLQRQGRFAFGRTFSSRYVFPPDFVIAGVQRGGTTSLYKYLSRHPSIGPSIVKEIHFFDENFHKGMPWYRAHFPSWRDAERISRDSGTRMVTGEASPFYMFHPRCARRIATSVPAMKTIVLLRDPVRRAYSHYCLTASHGRETLSFEDAIAAEPDRLEGEMERIRSEPSYRSTKLHYYSYVARGMYADQLERWFEWFPRGSVLILNSDDLFTDPGSVLRKVCAFLDLEPIALEEYLPHNVRSSLPGRSIKPETEALLRQRFSEPNQRLRDLLETDIGWRS